MALLLLYQLPRQLIRFGGGFLAEVVLADVGGGFVVDEFLVLEERAGVGGGRSRAAEYRGDRAAACLPLTHTQERPGGSDHRAAWGWSLPSEPQGNTSNRWDISQDAYAGIFPQVRLETEARSGVAF